MNKELDYKCEETIRFLGKYMIEGEKWRKPILLHGVRVGLYLRERGYKESIVITGFLHDVLEDAANVTDEMLRENFGPEVLRLVKASTKKEWIPNQVEDDIQGKSRQREELLARCIAAGEDALIVKVADIIDNTMYYKSVGNADELENHCDPQIDHILEHLPVDFKDSIFYTLRKLQSEK